MSTFLDRSLLILIAVICSIFAWFFWSSLEQNAFDVLGIIVMGSLIIDNYHLRKKLKKKCIV